jgi:hypothetical protein
MKTMFITVLILFVLVINVIDGLSCIDDGIIEISLDELTHEKFQEEMNDIVSSDYDDNIVCGIIITVDYTTNKLTIEFDPGLSAAPMGDINYLVILYTTFTRAPAQMHTSELLISCSSEDNCDEKFLTMDDHYQWWWLIDEVNHTEIEQMFKKLFISEESTPSAVQCYDAATIIPCSSKVCLLEDIDWNDPSQTCRTNTQRKLYLIIQTQIMINSQTNQLIHAVDYACQFDLCNDRSILVQVNNITDMHYHVSPMLRVFTRKPIIEPSATSIITQPSLILTSIQSSFGSSPAQSSFGSSPIQSSSTVRPVELTSTSSPSKSSSTSSSIQTTTTASPIKPNTTSNPIQSSSTSSSIQTTTTASPIKSNTTSNPIQSSPTSSSIESSSTSILIQSTTEVNSTGDRLKVSIKLISLIFQICASLFL